MNLTPTGTPQATASARRGSFEGGIGIPDGRRIYGELLQSTHLLDRNRLQTAIDHSESKHTSLPEAIVALGFVSEIDAYVALAQATGLPLVDLHDTKVSELAVRLIPERQARRHELVPIAEDNRTLTYAIARPFDSDADNDIAFASGRRARAVLAPRSQVLAALDRYYPKTDDIAKILGRLRADPRVGSAHSLAVTTDPDSPVVELCAQILKGAVDANASDIHVEPFADEGFVRYRLAGILEPILTIPREAVAHVVNRFKILARANIALHHQPQDGQFRLTIHDHPVDVRLSTLPTVHGEKIVMRIVDSRSPLQTLDALGYEPDTLERLRHALARPDGLILFTGPTACGKTTALYAALNELRTGRTNILTVEDPVERYVPGVSQVAVNTKAGASFAAVLRSVLRQDPNVIMVGEIRDSEVAQMVGQAAYTGHLVLSSLHTMDAAAAVGRLQNLGLEPFRIAETLAAIFAQRLVRRLCSRCKVMLPEDEARALGAAHGITAVAAKAGKGCDQCRQTGYMSRVPVAEVLTLDDTLRAAVRAGAGERELRAAMRAAGYRTMREAALDLVAKGVTSLEEINRVLADEDVPMAAPGPRLRLRVLVADDDRMIRLMVRRLLEKEAFDVVEATNGRQAVDLARREHPNLMILDLGMPEMDGYAAIAELKQDLALADIPVMVLTAQDESGVEERVLELGADDYLIKPIEPGVLLSRVRAAFRRAIRAAA